MKQEEFELKKQYKATFSIETAHDMYGVNCKTKHTINPSDKKLHILLAEDDFIHQKVINHLLTILGHTVIIASNGKQALEMFEPNYFDLILMDIRMPILDGVAATQKLNEIYDDLPPIVGLSAIAFDGDREKYMSLGMDEYLRKPAKKEDFKKCFESLCYVVS